jgi:chitin disaccharide deacetylase
LFQHRAKQFGVPLSHLDTHMGALVSRPDLPEVFVQVGIEFDLPVLFLRTVDADTPAAFPVLNAARAQWLPQLEQRGFPVLDHLLQFYDGANHEERRARHVDALRSLQPGVSELIVHCGIDNDELRAITNSASRRDGDRRIFMEPEIRALIQECGIELTNWKQLRREVRSGFQPRSRP